MKKISIITPSLNRMHMLEDAIRNVSAQGYPNFEHIVVDGGSIDGTHEMVGKYPHVKYVSGPDSGMYDALNKGLNIAVGEIIGFLNTDDLYADDVFFDIGARFENENVMAVAGCATVFYKTNDGRTVIIGRYFPRDKTLLECSTIGSNYFNAWFFRKSVFEKIGRFNVNYRIVGDRDFMLRFALHDLHYIMIDKIIYQYLQHPESLTFHDTDEKREWSVKEHLDMTSFYLRNERLSRLEKKLLFQLRTNETVDMATRAIRKGEFRKFVYYSCTGARNDLFWSVKFIWSALAFRFNKGVGFLKNKFKKIKRLISGKGWA